MLLLFSTRTSYLISSYRDVKRNFEKLWEVRFIGEGVIDQVMFCNCFVFARLFSLQ